MLKKNFNEYSNERKRNNLNETEPYIREITSGPSHDNEMNAESFTPIFENVITGEQLLQGPPLKIYKSAHLRFDTPAEDDTMEWIYIEPSTSEKVSAMHNNTNKESKEKKIKRGRK